MEPFIMYILKVCLAVSLLFIVYLLALQQEKFFRLNRFILLITVTLPFFLPFLPEIHNSPVSQFQQGIMAFRPFDSSFAEPLISNNALPAIALPVNASTT